jgi:predicted DsbA family dithiol-disulfide isomerase
MKQVKISHFSDVLCIWAYVSQIRLQELNNAFKEQVVIDYHYLPTFADVSGKMQASWAHRGGVEAYAKHVASVADQFPHIKLHADCWEKTVPTTSQQSHLFLKAVQLMDVEEGSECHDSLAWSIREAFFSQALDVSDMTVLEKLASDAQIDIEKVRQKIKTGEAIASLSRDMQLRTDMNVDGSPSLVFNEGRQKLYGNVGYLTIEANIKELLINRQDSASWC